ncbi:hypothetical protein NK983_28725, partial [Salmonella enterica subsp. enterica serovar Typhimurium]|nr:hypothetical protein [Salmonella enterica subsp. enterica serovar Typhimurium]
IRPGGVADRDPALQTQPLEILGDASGTWFAVVKSQQVELGPFEQVRRLAAGCGAGVEHTLAGCDIEQCGCVLGAEVLHRQLAVGEAGQA